MNSGMYQAQGHRAGTRHQAATRARPRPPGTARPRRAPRGPARPTRAGPARPGARRAGAAASRGRSPGRGGHLLLLRPARRPVLFLGRRTGDRALVEERLVLEQVVVPGLGVTAPGVRDRGPWRAEGTGLASRGGAI